MPLVLRSPWIRLSLRLWSSWSFSVAEESFYLFIHSGVDEHALYAAAGLPRVGKSRPHYAVDSLLHIGVRPDNSRVRAAL
jgi:hypothetical protein